MLAHNIRRAPAAALDASLLLRPRAPQPPAAEPSEVVALSVRLPPELHLRLRLLSVHTRRSRRAIVRAAIERGLAAMAASTP